MNDYETKRQTQDIINRLAKLEGLIKRARLRYRSLKKSDPRRVGQWNWLMQYKAERELLRREL